MAKMKIVKASEIVGGIAGRKKKNRELRDAIRSLTPGDAIPIPDGMAREQVYKAACTIAAEGMFSTKTDKNGAIFLIRNKV